MAVTSDDRIWPRLLQARACLCSALEDRGLGGKDLCLCAVVHGDPDLTLVADGKFVAWVRPLRIFPSSTLPTQSQRVGDCTDPFAVDIEFGVARCAIVPTRTSVPAAVQEQEASIAMADYAAMLAAVCCLDTDTVIGTYTPQRLGGVYGGTLTVTVAQAD